MSSADDRCVTISPAHDGTWRLLQLHHLLVGELRAVVDEVEGVVGVAVAAQRGFGDAAALDLHGNRRLAHVATAKSRGTKTKLKCENPNLIIENDCT